MRATEAAGWFGSYAFFVTSGLLLWPLYVVRNLPRLLFSSTLFPLGFGLIVADQVLKWAAVAYLKDRPPVVLIPGFLDLTYVTNMGAAFGLFRGQITAFILIALFTVGVIVVYLSVIDDDEKLVSVALVMILAGAVGNLIDRVCLGYVIDYIHVHWNEWSWPVFNLADTIIDVGVGLILLDVLLEMRSESEGEPSPVAGIAGDPGTTPPSDADPAKGKGLPDETHRLD